MGGKLQMVASGARDKGAPSSRVATLAVRRNGRLSTVLPTFSSTRRPASSVAAPDTPQRRPPLGSQPPSGQLARHSAPSRWAAKGPPSAAKLLLPVGAGQQKGQSGRADRAKGQEQTAGEQAPFPKQQESSNLSTMVPISNPMAELVSGSRDSTGE